MIFEGACATED